MPVYVCSLIRNEPQAIPSGGYHVVRFPFGTAESYDAHGMHQVAQPDGYEITDWRKDDRSGLIWPSADGWADLYGLMYWESGDYTEVRSRFVRDPLDLSTGYDSTCTEDDARTPGGQYRAKHWGLFSHVGTPLALLVQHNAPGSLALTHAQFKVAIHV
ncbi:hypothetical protein ACQEU5_15260 [Marinactinospora thermotolerans]|uniref:hypothetical protein n=1 Tax=Marinactinospora thermotolerans TaxID=531310 RepID=UPI003D8BD2AF